jgi:hypothetical protein
MIRRTLGIVIKSDEIICQLYLGFAAVERLPPKQTSVVRESLVQIRPPQLRLANKPVITIIGQRILFSARQHGPFWRRPKRLKPG